jgi:hypothetical protein
MYLLANANVLPDGLNANVLTHSLHLNLNKISGWFTEPNGPAVS